MSGDVWMRVSCRNALLERLCVIKRRLAWTTSSSRILFHRLLALVLKQYMVHNSSMLQYELMEPTILDGWNIVLLHL
jgi:hypothetical protein